eukprot:SAG11_NODE_619_length_8173_cov_4.837255_4_plen_295_part_00
MPRGGYSSRGYGNGGWRAPRGGYGAGRGRGRWVRQDGIGKGSRAKSYNLHAGGAPSVKNGGAHLALNKRELEKSALEKTTKRRKVAAAPPPLVSELQQDEGGRPSLEIDSSAGPAPALEGSATATDGKEGPQSGGSIGLGISHFVNAMLSTPRRIGQGMSDIGIGLFGGSGSETDGGSCATQVAGLASNGLSVSKQKGASAITVGDRSENQPDLNGDASDGSTAESTSRVATRSGSREQAPTTRNAATPIGFLQSMLPPTSGQSMLPLPIVFCACNVFEFRLKCLHSVSFFFPV